MLEKSRRFSPAPLHSELGLKTLAQQPRAAPLVPVGGYGRALGRVQPGQRRAGQVVAGLLPGGRQVGQAILAGTQAKPVATSGLSSASATT